MREKSVKECSRKVCEKEERKLQRAKEGVYICVNQQGSLL